LSFTEFAVMKGLAVRLNNDIRQRKYRLRPVQLKAKDPLHPWTWRIGLFLAGLLVLGINYVYLISATERMQREHRRLLRAYDEGSKALENVRLELESYKSPNYIETQVKLMNLGLHPPYPGQVRRLSLKGRTMRADFSEDGLVPEVPEELARHDLPATKPLGLP